MSEPNHKNESMTIRSQLSQGWQLLVALGLAALLVGLKRLDGITVFGFSGHWAGLAGVLTALLASCLLIKWIGAAAPALLFMSVFLVAVGYMSPAEASDCLKQQLADPFVLIVFSGFTLLSLMFGMPSERGTPPAWALRPGELVGRDGERLRSRMGRFCLRLLAVPLWARLAALLPGFVMTLVSSGVGADAMARMAAIPKKSSTDLAPRDGKVDNEDQQNTLATVFVLSACVLAPALIPVSLWGLFFSMQAGAIFAHSPISLWLAASYPFLMALLLPGWLWWSTGRMRRQPVIAYYSVYAIAWAVIILLAYILQKATREQLALNLLIFTVLYSSIRIFRRCWHAMRIPPSANLGVVIRPLHWWASKVEWELIKGGFSRALGVVVIVVFAAIFRKVIEKAVPPGVELDWVTQFPLSALVFCVVAVLAIGISIGTAFGTFVLGLALVRIMWPEGFPLAGQAPIIFWLLVSISAAINQISPQADNVEVMEKYADRGKLTSMVSGVVLPTLAVSVLISLAGWLFCCRAGYFGWDLAVGLMLLVGCGVGVYLLRKRQGRSGLPQAKHHLIWMGVVGQSARTLVEQSRIAGEFIAHYDSDNDISNVKPENAEALLRTVPLEGDAAWALAEGPTKPDTLLLLIGRETSAADVLVSPLVARYLRFGCPKIRVVQLLSDDDITPHEASDILKRIGGVDVKVYYGQEGLKILSHKIVECLDHREGVGPNPEIYDWLFSVGKSETANFGKIRK
jgi:hypothetical protein